MNKLVFNSIRINFVTPYNLNKMIHVKHQVYPFITFWYTWTKHRGNIMQDYDKVLKFLLFGDKDVGKTQIMFK